MILNRLVKFAETADQKPEGYQERLITRAIDLDANGNLIGVFPLAVDVRGKRHGELRPEPEVRRTSNIAAWLFADNAVYVTGYIPQGDSWEKVVKPDEAARSFEAWKNLALECATDLNLPQTGAIKKWIESGGLEQLARTHTFEETDQLSIRVDGVYVTDLPEVRSWWANRGKEYSQGFCLVTGEYGPVVDRMPFLVGGVPNQQSSGAALVSVNFAAGDSYGLKAALNSPISPAAAAKVCNGLEILLNERLPGQDRYRYAVKVGPTAFLGWCSQPLTDNEIAKTTDPTDEDEDSLTDFKKSEKTVLDEVRATGQVSFRNRDGKQELTNESDQLKQAPRTLNPDLDSDFYLLILSANAARLVVRDFVELSLGKVRENRQQWFRRLQVGSTPRRPSIYALAASLYRNAKDIPVDVTQSLGRAALVGSPIPKHLLALAIKRNIAMQGPYTLSKSGKPFLDDNRMALVKAILTNPEDPDSLTMLNPEHPEPAYQCGRLLAILESIQKLAVPGINATIVDRNFATVSANPGLTFPRLITLATQAHMPKLKRDKPGAAVRLEKELSQAMSHISDRWPKTLSLEKQGLFSLGFYHQKSHDIAQAMARKQEQENES